MKPMTLNRCMSVTLICLIVIGYMYVILSAEAVHHLGKSDNILYFLCSFCQLVSFRLSFGYDVSQCSTFGYRLTIGFTFPPLSSLYIIYKKNYLN